MGSLVCCRSDAELQDVFEAAGDPVEGGERVHGERRKLLVELVGGGVAAVVRVHGKGPLELPRAELLPQTLEEWLGPYVQGRSGRDR